MTETSEQDDYADIGAAPGDDDAGPYLATAFMRGGGRGGGGFIWFSCKDGGRDRILQLANLREMEPGDVSGTRAWLHFSGMDVQLEGTGMRQVAHRLFLGRCSIVYEIRPGQKPARSGDPVIRSIRFLVPPPESGKATKPKHEPETERAEH
jgi:hypothetical protein